MGKKAFTWLAAAILSFTAMVSADTQAREAALTGLWQGVDSVDGSLRTLSIEDLDGDGTYEVLGHDSYWSLCEGSRGLERASGKVGEDGILRVAGSIHCASGKAVDIETTFTPQGSSGALLEEVVGQPFKTLLFRIGK